MCSVLGVEGENCEVGLLHRVSRACCNRFRCIFNVTNFTSGRKSLGACVYSLAILTVPRLYFFRRGNAKQKQRSPLFTLSLYTCPSRTPTFPSVPQGSHSPRLPSPYQIHEFSFLCNLLPTHFPHVHSRLHRRSLIKVISQQSKEHMKY